MFKNQDWMKLSCLTSPHQEVSMCLSNCLYQSLCPLVNQSDLWEVFSFTLSPETGMNAWYVRRLLLLCPQKSPNLVCSFTPHYLSEHLAEWFALFPCLWISAVFWISCMLNCRSAETTNHSWDWKILEFQSWMWKVSFYTAFRTFCEGKKILLFLRMN